MTRIKTRTMGERTKPFYLWADCHNSMSSDLQKINLQTTKYQLSRDVQWEVSLKAVDFYVRGSSLVTVAGTNPGENIRMWSLHMSALNPEQTTALVSTSVFKSTNTNQILKFILTKGTSTGGVRVSHEYPRAEYLPIQDNDLQRVTFQAVEHATQYMNTQTTGSDYRLINTVTFFDEMLLLLHFRPRSDIPVSVYSLFANGYDFDTSQEFTYTLSSQDSPTQSSLNPYKRLPQTMRLQQDSKYEWSVAMTQISYNPTGTIPITIQGTGTLMSGTVTSSFTIQANITLQMLCNLRDKLAPYLVQQFNDAMTTQRPSTVSATADLPAITLSLVGNRWQLSWVSFPDRLHKQQHRRKIAGSVHGFCHCESYAETSLDQASQVYTRRASEQLDTTTVRVPVRTRTEYSLHG